MRVRKSTNRFTLNTRLFSCLAVVFLVLSCVFPVTAAEDDLGLLKGVVVDESGQPVVGARVTIVRVSGDQAATPFSPDFDALTDDQGRFEARLNDARYMCSVTKDTLSSDDAPFGVQHWGVKAGKTKELSIPIKQGTPVHGVVVSKDTGEPVADAGVVLQNGRTTRTDPQGKFVIEGVAARSSKLTVLAPGFADEHHQFYLPDQGAYGPRIELEKGYTVRGRVLDEQGNPVAGAVVGNGYPYLNMRRCVTDERGNYEIGGRRAGERAEWDVHHPDFAKLSTHGLEAPDSGDVVELDFVLIKGYEVQGHVYGPDGKPIKDAKVSYGFSTSYVHYADTTTDESGHYRLKKLSDDREEFVVVQAKGCSPAYKLAKPGRGGAAPNLDFKLDPSCVAEGVVVDTDGQPIPHAKLGPQMLLQGSNFCSPSQFDISHNVESDEQGRFKLEDIPPKDLVVYVSAEGYQWADNIPIEPGADNRITLDRPAAIVCKVVDAKTKKPVVDFNVKLDFSQRGRTPGLGLIHSEGKDFNSPDGAFTIHRLDNGAPYLVVVTADGYAPARVDEYDAAPADSSQWPAVIEMDKGLTISGTVADAQAGAPLRDAEVFLVISPRALGSSIRVNSLEEPDDYIYDVQRTRTDEQGRFRFPLIAKGQSLYLAARHTGYALALERKVEPGKPTTLKLHRGGRIIGTALGYPDLDLTKADVSVRAEGFELPNVSVQPNGNFEIPNVPPGECSVYLRQEFSGKRQTTVNVKPGKTVSIDFAHLYGRRVSGRVMCAGQPVPGAYLCMNQSLTGDWVVGGDTDSDGRFSYRGIPSGEYTLYVTQGRPRDLDARSRKEYFVVSDADVQLDVEFHRNRIAGRVIDAATAEPLAEAYVSAQRVGQTDNPNQFVTCVPRYTLTRFHGNQSKTLGLRLARSMAGVCRLDRTYGSGKRQGDGSFDIENIPPGTYRLSVDDLKGPVGWCSDDIELGPDDELTDIVLKIDRSADLRLRVLDSKTGNPVPEALIHLCKPDGYPLCSSYRKPRDPSDKSVTCGLGGCGGPSSPYTYESMATDDKGTFALSGVQSGSYGVWAVAHGYAARWISPVRSGETCVVKLHPTGSLVLKPKPGLLDGIVAPSLAYRVEDARGNAVFPGGVGQGYEEIIETGAAPLWGDNAGGYTVDVLPPGKYTLKWEIHSGFEGDAIPRPIKPAVCSGQTRFRITPGKESVVVLSG